MKRLTPETIANKKIRDHIEYAKGTKTICVSTVLSFLGISPDDYTYTSSKKNRYVYEGVLRRNGYSVRSRMSELKLRKGSTMTKVRKALRKSDYGSKDYFMYLGYQKGSAHLILLNGNGKTIIDTAPSKRYKLESIKIVEKN